MHNMIELQMIECQQHLIKYDERFLLSESWLAGEVIEELSTPNQLRYHVEVFRVLLQSVYFNYVGMILHTFITTISLSSSNSLPSNLSMPGALLLFTFLIALMTLLLTD